ncbi:putative upf0311 protein [Rosellinia necatrix]|uniref:Putative upf0311 protein n=1 Tax=Rosellinia necatrix TaxID=77044 RepID=A0A1W2TEZ9_ROSNE|nr:putative upf0311 protein [Rosellinia necatrix]
MGASSREHVIPGSIYGGVPRLPQLPPLIPLPETSTGGVGGRQSTAPAAAMEWDTAVVSHGISWPQVDHDRRHSGWEEVERWWTKQQGEEEGQGQQRPQQHANPAPGTGSVRTGPLGRGTKTTAPFLYPHLAIPVPGLESDFRMRVKLNSQSASVAVSDGFKKWTTFADGEWSGQLGSGIVVGGGQDSQDLVCGKTFATQVEATHRLKTSDEVPAIIECKTRGFRTGPPELMRVLQDPERDDPVNARLIQYRAILSMKTTDERYAEKVNFGLWVGSCLWKGSEVIYDAYRIT